MNAREWWIRKEMELNGWTYRFAVGEAKEMKEYFKELDEFGEYIKSQLEQQDKP